MKKVGCKKIYHCLRSAIYTLSKDNPECDFAVMKELGDICGDGKSWWECSYAQIHACGAYVCTCKKAIEHLSTGKVWAYHHENYFCGYCHKVFFDAGPSSTHGIIKKCPECGVTYKYGVDMTDGCTYYADGRIKEAD